MSVNYIITSKYRNYFSNDNEIIKKFLTTLFHNEKEIRAVFYVVVA